MTRERHASHEHTGESQAISDTPGLQDGTSPATVDHELISRRAYERFQLRGGEHGRDHDWLEAERELNSPRRE